MKGGALVFTFNLDNIRAFVIIRIRKGKEAMSHKVRIVIEKDEYGYYAFSPELEGCQTQGDSLEEIIANMNEATELFLETTTSS
jgi:predicted RNase H-like HicB family nuclease